MDTHTLERRLLLPPSAPPRLVEDIRTYHALVSMQNRMSASAPWYQRLS